MSLKQGTIGPALDLLIGQQAVVACKVAGVPLVPRKNLKERRVRRQLL